MPLRGADTYSDYGIFFIGDSKSAGTPDDATAPTYTLYEMRDRDRGRFYERPLRSATSGIDTAVSKAGIDAALAARTDTPRYICYNLGANDVVTLPVEATWKTNTLYIWDACHTKWPNALIYIVNAWRQTYDSNCDTLATWMSACLALRPSFVFQGWDERVDIKAGDDGATYTVDGTHYNEAGKRKAALRWREVLTA